MPLRRASTRTLKYRTRRSEVQGKWMMPPVIYRTCCSSRGYEADLMKHLSEKSGWREMKTEHNSRKGKRWLSVMYMCILLPARVIGWRREDQKAFRVRCQTTIMGQSSIYKSLGGCWNQQFIQWILPRTNTYAQASTCTSVSLHWVQHALEA